MNNVIGHTNAKKILLNSIKNNRVGHAYIFEGTEGVGRMTLAKAFALKLAGDMGKYSADAHPDIIIASNEKFDSSKKSLGLSIDATRAMKADVYIRPFCQGRKIYIVPNADNMLSEAQNSLLKVFEEPPEYCTIILLVQNTNTLLQTIRSRAQLIKLHNLDADEVSGYLTSNNITHRDKAAALAVLSGGSIGNAIKLSEDSDAVSRREEVINFLIGITYDGSKKLYDFIKYLKQNKSDIISILNIMSDWSRDVLYMRTGVNHIINIDKKQELEQFCSRVSRASALRFVEIISKYTQVIGRNVNYPIAVTCMAMEYWEEIHDRSYRSAF